MSEPSPPPGARTVPGNRWDLLDGIEPRTPPLVSVIVVHYEQPAQLARTLAALARQTHERLELIVVDDGSAQPPRVPPGVTLLIQEDRGFRAAAARNLGARAARGEVLCFLDADTTPEPDYVARLTRLPAIAPEAVTVARREHADFASDPPTPLPAPAWLTQGYHDTRDLLDADERSYRYVISAVMACSAWLFALTGGFDESFEQYGGEDWEWAHRAWLAGAILAHVPTAVARHDGPDFGGRPTDRRRAKNAEALRLADAIPVAGSRPRAVRTGRRDVVIRLDHAPSPAAALICIDSLLEALPQADVEVPAEHAEPFAADARVGITQPAARLFVQATTAISVDRDRMRAVIESIGDDVLQYEDEHGTLLRIVPLRAHVRQRRWAPDDPLPAHAQRATWVQRLPHEPDLEAYLGGWD